MTTGSRPQKTAMLVAQRIVADIARQGIAVGGKLPPERVMLQDYEVGRGTLRESLRFLELQGVISLKPGPGGGPVVCRPDAAALATSLTLLLQFSDVPLAAVADARAALEPAVARSAAHHMDPADVELLRAGVARMRDHIDDPAVFPEENAAFHSALARGARSPVLAHLVDAVHRVLAVGPTPAPDRAARRAALDAHHRIAEAVAAGDADTAERAMREHVSVEVASAARSLPGLATTSVAWTL